MTSHDSVLIKASFRIEIISPVHIGTGESLNDKSFIVVDKEVHVIDERKFMNKVTSTPQLRTGLERFCMGDESLARFLRQHNIHPKEVTLYSIRKMGQRDVRSVLPFIKMPELIPKPYIPGSSLKGALRSAFLRNHLLGSDKARLEGEERVKEKLRDGKPKKADDALEQWYFGKDQHHEWLRLLQFTDTRPVDVKELGVAEVLTFSSTQDLRLQQKTFVLNPEVLTPGSVLDGGLVVNRYLTQPPARKELAKPDLRHLENIAKAFNQVADEQIEQEKAFYGKLGQSDLVEWYEKLSQRRKSLRSDRLECLVRLGWGTGYDNKTVSDVFSDETFDEIRRVYDLPVGKPGRRGKPLPKALSPKSRKLALRQAEDGTTEQLPMGWLVLKVT